VTTNSILASKDWNDPMPAVEWDYPPEGAACSSFAVQQLQAPCLVPVRSHARRVRDGIWSA
jgi:hypothetical protein